MGFDHVKTSVPLCRALAFTACWVLLAMARAHLEDSMASVRYWLMGWLMIGFTTLPPKNHDDTVVTDK